MFGLTAGLTVAAAYHIVEEFWDGESAGLASCCPGSWMRRRSRWRRSCSSWWRRRSSGWRRRRRRSRCLKFFHSSSYFQHLAKILLQQYRNYAAATFTTFFAAVFGSDSNAIRSKWVCIVVELNFNEIHPKVWRCSLPLLSEAGAALPPRVEIKAAADLLSAPALALHTPTSSCFHTDIFNLQTLQYFVLQSSNSWTIEQQNRHCRTKAAEHKSRSYYNCERITLRRGRS